MQLPFQVTLAHMRHTICCELFACPADCCSIDEGLKLAAEYHCGLEPSPLLGQVQICMFHIGFKHTFNISGVVCIDQYPVGQ